MKKSKNKTKTSPQNKLIRKPISGYIFLGLLILALPLVYSKSTLDPVIMPRLLALNIIIILSAPFILKGKSPDLSLKIFLPIVAYLFITAFSLLFAYNAKEGLYNVIKTLSFLWLVLLLTISFQKSEPLSGSLAFFVSLAALIALGIGFYDFLMVGSSLQNSLLPDGQPAFYAVKGLMAHKNQYAISLMLMLPFTLFGIFKYTGPKKIIAIIASALTLVMIVLLRTRSVWVGTAGGVFSALILVSIYHKSLGIAARNLKKLVFISIAGIAIILAIVIVWGNDNSYSIPSLVKNITDYKSATNINRVKIWNVTIDLINDHPILGVGSGNWKINIPEYFGTTHFDKKLLNWLRPHNDYLWVWAEKGIIGLIAFLSIFISAIYFGNKLLMSNTINTQKKIFLVILLSSLISYLLVSFFTFPLERINQQVYLALILASIFAIHQSKQQDKTFHYPPRFLLIIVLISAIISILYSSAMIKQEMKISQTRYYETKKDWQAMLTSAHEISTQFRSIDIDGMPINWYAGFAYQNLNKFNDAITEYEAALEAHPTKVIILNNLGYCYAELKNYDASIATYRKALVVEPVYFEALVNLSTSYYRSGKYDSCYRTLLMIPDYQRDERLIKYIHSVSRKQNLLSQKYWDIDSISFSGNIIDQYYHHIQNNRQWYDQVMEKSKKKGISVDEALFREACYVAEKKNFEKYLTWMGEKHFIKNIKNDSLWMNQIRELSLKKGISEQVEVEANANFIFKSKYPDIFQKNLILIQYKNQILNDDEWRSRLEKQAAMNGLDSKILIDATAGFLFDANNNRFNDFEERVSEIVMQIQNTPEWYNLVKEKANKLHKPIEHILRKEAIYLVERQD